MKKGSDLSVNTSKGKLEKLEVLKNHCWLLSFCSVDSAFEYSWKEEVDGQMSQCSTLSQDRGNSVLDVEVE